MLDVREPCALTPRSVRGPIESLTEPVSRGRRIALHHSRGTPSRCYGSHHA